MLSQAGGGKAQRSTLIPWNYERCLHRSNGGYSTKGMAGTAFYMWLIHLWFYPWEIQQQEAAFYVVKDKCSHPLFCLPASLGLYTHTAEPRRPAKPVGFQGEDKGMPKRHLEARTQEDRAKQRQGLGSLQDLTVQPATKARYKKAIDGFL